MIPIRSYIIVVFSFLLWVAAKAEIGQWMNYNAMPTLDMAQCFMGRLYILSGSSLCTLPTDDISQPFRQIDQQNGLSGHGIKYLLKCDSIQRLVVVYADCNIDIIYPDESISNIPDVAARTVSGDKTIYDAYIDNKLLYLSCGFGFVVINLEKETVEYSVLTNHALRFSFTLDRQLFRYSDAIGLEMCPLDANIQYDKNWKSVGTKRLVKKGMMVEVAGQRQPWFIAENGELLTLNSDYEFSSVIDGHFTDIDPLDQWWVLRAEGSKTFVDRQNGMVVTNTDTPLKDFDQLSCDGEGHYFGLIYNEHLYCMSLGWYSPGEGIYFDIQYESHRQTTGIDTDNLGELQITTNGVSGIARLGYIFGASAANANRGSICHYDASTDSWSKVNLTENITNRLPEDCAFQGLSGLAIDPTNPHRMAISSSLFGLYFFDHDTLTAHYDGNASNGWVQAFSKDYTSSRVSSVAFDYEGNLFYANSVVDTVLRCITPDGQCIKYANPGMMGVSDARRILIAEHDNYGFKWVLNDYGWQKSRVGIYYDHHTPLDTSDDECTHFFNLVDQDENIYTPNYILDLCEDRQGRIWLLTTMGPLVIDNPYTTYTYAKQHSGRGLVRRIKIPRNDGTNLADYLMANTMVNCMAVDNFDRKWIGTIGSGLYLMSSDCLTELAHFTAETSPLTSDNIQSLAFDPIDGRLYISCQGTIQTLQTDAIEGRPDMEEIYCYPNPVRPEYTGNVTIMGLMNDSQVSITDASGNLIMRTQSQGATMQWNVRDNKGQRVAPGVYFIHSVSSDGKQGSTCKLMVF